MRRRPPLPLGRLSAEDQKDREGPPSSQLNDEWEMIRKQALNSFAEVRSIVKSRRSSHGLSQSEMQTSSDPGQVYPFDFEEVTPSLEESSSLYSFWNDLGLTLSAILSSEEGHQEIIALTNASAQQSLRDETSLDSINLTSTFAPTQPPIKNPTPSSYASNAPTSKFKSTDQEKGFDKWRQLYDQHCSIQGAYGGSHYLTWEQLITPPSFTPPSLTDLPLNTRRRGNSRSAQRRRMRIAKLQAHYEQI